MKDTNKYFHLNPLYSYKRQLKTLHKLCNLVSGFKSTAALVLDFPFGKY